MNTGVLLGLCWFIIAAGTNNPDHNCTKRTPHPAAAAPLRGIPSLLTHDACNDPCTSPNVSTTIHHLGVHYIFIPACLSPTARRKPICGGMHLWLKAVQSPHDTWVVEGFYYFEEAIRPRLWAALKLENPPLLQRHPITMTIFNAANSSMHRVHTYQPIDAYRPGWLHASIPQPHAAPNAEEDSAAAALHPHHTLFIEDWRRHVALSSVLTRATPWQPVSKEFPDVYTVVGQFYGIPIDRAEHYLAVHTEYHRSIGAAGTLFYYSDEHAMLFDHAPKLRALQQRRVLTMVAWPYMARVPGAATYDQARLVGLCAVIYIYTYTYIY